MAGPATSGATSGATGRVRPSVRGVVAGALGMLLLAVGVRAGYPVVRGLGLGLLAVVGVGLVGILLPVPVRVERTISPARVTRGDPCEGRLTLVSTSSRFGASLDATDRVDGRPVVVDVPWLGAGESATVAFPIPTDRVGRLTIGPLTVRRTSFAGLWTATQEVGDTRDLLVTPRTLRCAGVPAGLTRGHVGADERVERGGTDLTGLREYVPGDDLRRLHWATTARTGTLMVREDSDPSRAHLTVLVDDSAADDAGVGADDDGDFDEMADAAASLLHAAVAAGHPARLVSLRGRADVDLPAGLGAAAAPLLVLEPALVALCDLASAAGDEGSTPALHDTDVLAIVGSRRSDRQRLGAVSLGPRPVLLLVDPGASTPISWSGGSAVVTGPRAADVLAGWDTIG